MGYQLTSLGNLPVQPDIDLYIFVVDGNWRGGRFEILEDNFSEIARAIGPKAIIAKGFKESLWSEELCRRYLGKEYDAILPHLPALLITNAHPAKLTDESLRLLIPLGQGEEEFGDLESFFRGLSRFAEKRDPQFLRRFEDQRDWIKEGNKIIDLKPNFFGIGVNLNEFIRRIRTKIN